MARGAILFEGVAGEVTISHPGGVEDFVTFHYSIKNGKSQLKTGHNRY